jgi:hypothetical protein
VLFSDNCNSYILKQVESLAINCFLGIRVGVSVKCAIADNIEEITWTKSCVYTAFTALDLALVGVYR